MTRILLVDDDAALSETLELDLVRRGYGVQCRRSAAAALAAMQESEFDVIVTDLRMPETNGIDFCRTVVERRPDVPVVVLTAFGSYESAVEAMRAGAFDFLSKPVRLDVLAIAVDRAAEHRTLVKRVRKLEREATPETEPELTGSSSAFREVVELLGRVAETETTVLVTGESGTGKELVARAIHKRSRRRDGPFVAINCAAVPESLLESELFGHVRGAFTDARTSEPGLFVAANGGTILLDEIGDMPLAIQPKLLRVLQERTVRAVGANTERPIDVRVVAATNRDLETAVEEGRFREDLYYRINVVHVPVPPLRARAADIFPLAQRFATEFARRSGREITGISVACARRLATYAWPGNIRELQNCMERAVALARGEYIEVEDLPEKVRDHRASRLVIDVDDPSAFVPLEQIEREYIARALQAVRGNKSAAARLLGIERKRLYRLMDRLGVLRDT